MNRLLKLCAIVILINVVLCTQTMALDPDEMLAIRDGVDQALNTHDLDALVSYWTDDGVFDYVPLAEPLVGKEAIQGFFKDVFDGFPDFGTTEGRVLVGDNVVVAEHSTTGTHQGEWMGIPATGNYVTGPHIDIYEFEGDKVKRLTSYMDVATLLIQMGAMPAPDIPELTPSFAVPDHEATGLSAMEAHAELIRRWNSHDAALTAKIYHNDAKIFAGPLGAELDRVAMTAMNEMYFSAFPNTKQEVVRTIDLGDNWVLSEFVAYSTHQGPFMNVAPSGYPMETRNVWLSHYSEDGVFTQGSFYYDNVTFTNQMTTAPEYMPDGTWVVTVPTEAGNITLLHTVSPQKKMGGPFAGIMVQVNENPTAFGLFPEADDASDWLTKTVWKGRDKVETTMLVYGTQKGEGPLAETVYIGVAHSDWTLTGPNTNEGTAVEAFYLAAQDADQDGFPDPGEEPVACLEFTFTSKRLTMMPPCIPTPIP